MPLTAMAYFLPMCVEYSPGRRPASTEAVTGAGNDTSAAAPLRGAGAGNETRRESLLAARLRALAR
jgi:hypothetical protein